MSFSERVVVFFVRPVYHAFFEKPLWWFLARTKTFFFAEIGVQLGNFERRFLVEDAVSDQRWAALEAQLRNLESRTVATMEERLQKAEAANAAQWDAIERLLLALLHQPAARTPIESQDLQSSDSGRANGTGADLNRAHAANNIR